MCEPQSIANNESGGIYHTTSAPLSWIMKLALMRKWTSLFRALRNSYDFETAIPKFSSEKMEIYCQYLAWYSPEVVQKTLGTP